MVSRKQLAASSLLQLLPITAACCSCWCFWIPGCTKLKWFVGTLPWSGTHVHDLIGHSFWLENWGPETNFGDLVNASLSLSSLSPQPSSAALLSSSSQQLFSAAFLSSSSQQLYQQLFSSAAILSYIILSADHGLVVSYIKIFLSAISIILLWSGVGGQLLASSCCGQGLVVSY